MFDVAITGVGGQGSVLAAKLLAMMAHRAGYGVRTAETIGMAQRGGSVVSHVRIDDEADGARSDVGGLPRCSPLIPPASADVMIAFEPGEALRAIDLVAPDGIVVSAMTPRAPAGLAAGTYRRGELIDALAARSPALIVVDDEALGRELGQRRCLNTMLLAAAIAAEALPFSIDDLRAAVSATVKPRFEAINQEAITVALDWVAGGGES